MCENAHCEQADPTNLYNSTDLFVALLGFRSLRFSTARSRGIHMTLKFTAAVFSVILGATPVAIAAPATQSEAQRLAGLFETYVGKGSSGGPSPVTVTPRGDDYLVAINVSQILKPLEAFEVSLQAPPLSFSVTPQDGTLWRVVQSGMPELQIRFKDQNMKLLFDGLRFEGLYDPAMMSFKSGKTTQNSSTLENRTPVLLNIRRDGPSMIDMTSAPAPGGGLSAVVRGVTQDHVQTFKILQGGSDTEIGVSTGTISSNINIDALRNVQLMALWAFFVANPSEQALNGKLDEILRLVRQVLPLFNSIAQNASIQTVSITSPVGNFGMREAGVAFNMTGVHKQGNLGARIGLNGLTLPAAILPPWSQNLVPSDIVLDIKATGYDLEAAVEEILKVARPGVPQEESKAAGERAVFAIAPDGKVKVSLGPSQIVSKLLTINLEGEMTIIKPIPQGRLVMKAKGLDETIAALQAAAGSDPTVQQALMGLVAAKGFGKAEPDGSQIWVIENPNGGIPTINGMTIPGMGGK